MRRALILVAVLSLSPSRAEAAGVIRGTVWTSRGESRRAFEARERASWSRTQSHGIFDYMGTPALRRPKSATELPPIPTAGDSTPTPGIERAVLTVSRIPIEVDRHIVGSPGTAAVRDSATWCVSGGDCGPGVLVVAAGAMVEFQNRDTLWHRVFGTSVHGRIEIGALGPDERRSIALTDPGNYAILCGLHSAELGYLVVAPNHAFARPDSLGRFALPALPPGRYELALWDPDRGSARVWLDVPAGRDVYCDLSF